MKKLLVDEKTELQLSKSLSYDCAGVVVAMTFQISNHSKWRLVNPS